VGTRYCSNNCPYKVRRFNFFLFADFDTPSFKLGRNPDVSVRSRGRRWKNARTASNASLRPVSRRKKEDRDIREGEIKTACQQVCPTEAIVFGDIK